MEGTIEKLALQGVSTTGRGDTAETSPLTPNLIILLPFCYFPIHYYRPRPCSHATSSRKPSEMPPVRLTFFLPYSFSATPPSITVVTYSCPRAWTTSLDSDVPLSPHPVKGLVSGRNAAVTPTLLNCCPCPESLC